jgi:8-oxo-dGTP diphosphatase
MPEPPDPRARSQLSAGALFFDARARILLLHTTYKDHWEIPGGFVRPGESPRDGCRREVREELSIEPPIGRLLAVDWSTSPEEGDKAVLVFDGGLLDAEHLAAMRPGDGEIDGWAFHPVEDAAPLLIPRLHARLTAAAGARRTGGTAYLERGAASS